MKDKIKRLLAAAEGGMLGQFIQPPNQQEREFAPIVIAILAWCDGDENALRAWPDIARFFAVWSKPAPKASLTEV